MGSYFELNDTLHITTEQGFPADVFDLARHQRSPIQLPDIADRIFEFHGKVGPRLFHLDPVRVFWFHNIGGKWLAWGHIGFIGQGIRRAPNAPPSGLSNVSRPEDWTTWGRYRVVKVYDPDHQERFTRAETPPGLSYFG